MEITPVPDNNNYADYFKHIFNSICKAYHVPAWAMNGEIDPYNGYAPNSVGNNPAVSLNWYQLKQYQYPGCKALEVINETVWRYQISVAFCTRSLI